jgi:conjugative transfer signal peptidase TraF
VRPITSSLLQKYSRRFSRALVLVLVLATVYCTLIEICAGTGVRFNLSESLPGFLYVVATDDSPLIEFCLEGPFAALANARGYRRPGVCPDGAAPMIKPVVAREGDYVEVSPHGIKVNGILLPNTAPKLVDSHGQALVHFPFGTYFVPGGIIWVASEYNAFSFDSRYYGPLSTACIRHHVRRLQLLPGS